MDAKQTPELAAHEALLGYADLLDASNHGREYSDKHKSARKSIIKAFQDRERLLVALEEIMASVVVNPGEIRFKALVAITKAKEV